jgi:hypothetical protein
MKTIIHKLQFGTVPPKNKRRKRPTTNASNGSDGSPPPGPNFPFIEAVNGRAAMYGSSLGLVNWGLTGLNVIEQTTYPPFSLLGLGCTLLATYSVTKAFTTLTEEEFESFAIRNVGRSAMVAFTGLTVTAVANV